MKFKAYTGITWSLLELSGLLEDDDSHVHFERIKKHLGLHPFHLTNLNVALNEILSSGLNTYDSDLRGFLLAYKNPQLLTAFGDIFYDSCFVHVDVEAEFYIFRPQVGHTLKGIVNKKGYNHIGVLVHKAFNVSIPKPDNADRWPGTRVHIGQEVRFTIMHLDFTSRLPFIRGTLDQANYMKGCKLSADSNARICANESFFETNIESEDSCNETEETHEPTSAKETPKTPEKYSKKKRSLDNGDVQSEEDKKRTKKRLKTSQEFVHTSRETYEDASETSAPKISERNEAENVEYCDISYDNVNNVNSNDTPTKKRKKSEKRSKKLLEESTIPEPEFDFTNVTIKVERDLTTNSDTDEDTERKIRKREKKSKRESKKSKRSIDANCSTNYEETQRDIKVENKKHSKKSASSDVDTKDSLIEIKSERLLKSTCGTESTQERNERETVGNERRKSRKKSMKKSMTDSESESSVRVKVEKDTSESEHTQSSVALDIKSKDCPKKHKKKRANDEEQNLDGDVRIKEEKFELPKERSKSSVDKSVINEEQSEGHKGSPSKSKKRKTIDPETGIKIEDDTIIKHEFRDKKHSNHDSSSIESTNGKGKSKKGSLSPTKQSPSEFKDKDKDVKVFQNSYDTNFEERKATRSNSSSPRKSTEKSKDSRFEIFPGNVKIKIERSSSVES